MLQYSAHKICQKDLPEKIKQTSKTQNLTVKTQYLKVKAPIKNVKMQSHKTLTAQTFFYLNYAADGTSLQWD